MNDSRIPNHTPVLDTNIVEALVNLTDLFNTLIKGCLGSKVKNM